MNHSSVFARWYQCYLAPICTRIIYTLPWTHPSPRLKQHLKHFSRFFAQLTTVTDQQTDHTTSPVTTGRIYVRSAMRPNNMKIHWSLTGGLLRWVQQRQHLAECPLAECTNFILSDTTLYYDCVETCGWNWGPVADRN